MDVPVDWQGAPWAEESQPGYRFKTTECDGPELWRGEFTDAFVTDDWDVEEKLFVFHMVEGEATVRFRDGRVIGAHRATSASSSQ